MPITLKSVSNQTSGATAGTSGQATFPTGGNAPANNDLVIIQVSVKTNASVTNTTNPQSTTWNKDGQQANGTTVSTAIFYRKWVTGDSTTGPTFSWTGSVRYEISTSVWTGVDTSTPIDAASAGTTASTSPNFSTNTVTVVTNGAARLHFLAADIGRTYTWVTEDDEAYQNRTGTTSQHIVHGMAYQAGLATNNQTTKQMSVSGSHNSAVYTLVLRPATVSSGGILRDASAGSRGTGTTGLTAVLMGAGVNGTVTGTTVIVVASAFNTTLTCTIAGSTPSNIITSTNVGSVGLGGWYKANQSAVNGTDVSCNVTRVSGTDSLEIYACEVTGLDTSAPLDVTGVATGTSSGTATATTSSATASGTEFAFGWFSNGTNNAFTGLDANYDPRDFYNSGSTAQMPLIAQSIWFSGGSTKSYAVGISSTVAYSGAISTWKLASSGTQYTKTIQFTVTGNITRKAQAGAKRTLAVTGTLTRHNQSGVKKAFAVTGTVVRRAQTSIKKALAVTGTLNVVRNIVFSKLVQIVVTGTVSRRAQAGIKRTLAIAGTVVRRNQSGIKRALAVTSTVVRHTSTGLKKTLAITGTLNFTRGLTLHRLMQLAVTGTAVIRKQAQLRKSLLSTVSLSEKRSVAALRALQVSTVMQVLKRTSRSRSVAITSSVTMAYTKVFMKLLQVLVSVPTSARKLTAAHHTLLVSPTPTLHKLVARSSAVSAQVFLTTRKRTGKVAAVAVTAAAALRKRAGKVAGIAVTATASRAQRTGVYKTLQVTGTPAVTKRTSRLIQIASSVGLSVTKHVGTITRLITVAVSVTPSLVKSVLAKRALLVSVPLVRTQRTSARYALVVNATVATTKLTARTRQLLSSVSVTMTKQAGTIHRLYQLVVTGTPVVTKQVMALRGMNVKGFLTVRKRTSQINKAIPVSVQPTSFRYIGKRITGVAVTASASLRKQGLKPVRVLVTVTPSIVRGMTRLVSLLVSATPSMVRTFFVTVQLLVTVTATWTWRRLNMAVGNFVSRIPFVSTLFSLPKDDRSVGVEKQERALNIPPDSGGSRS